jgi:hypothetical protein
MWNSGMCRRFAEIADRQELVSPRTRYPSGFSSTAVHRLLPKIFPQVTPRFSPTTGTRISGPISPLALYSSKSSQNTVLRVRIPVLVVIDDAGVEILPASLHHSG